MEDQRLRMFDYSEIKRISRGKREYVTGGQRKFHKEVLHNLNSSSYITKMIKWKRIRGTGHAAHKGRQLKRI
jgi:hypothetical protein